MCEQNESWWFNINLVCTKQLHISPLFLSSFLTSSRLPHSPFVTLLSFFSLFLPPFSSSPTSCLSSAPSVPSSSSGCNAFSGRFGESSASPTSSSTTTETYLLVSWSFWNLLAVLKTSITLSGVESWLHW